MSSSDGFYTIKGYSLHEKPSLSNSMEDYLEMAIRLHLDNKQIRISELAKMLHVKASSATKMVQLLSESGYLESVKYGEILPTEKGKAQGEYLIYRHNVLQNFLCLLNHSESELEQVEKIEHFLDKKTIKNLELLTKQLQKVNII